MFKSVFTLFQYYLLQVPEIKYVGFYANQFNNLEGEREIPFPAALIEILPITNINNLGDRVQNTIVSVNIHVGTEIYKGLEDGDNQQNDGLDQLGLLDDVFAKLDNISTKSTGYPASGTTLSGITYDYTNFATGFVRRTNVIPTVPNSALRVSTIGFEMTLTDITAQPTWVYTEESGVTYELSGLTY